ncbi:uncharacterized protein LOC143255931 [Tachypleus tridentatus]|uniref:uncharacterized protein LOC143255931 n=1 Tax=Tachypleus tridentatus TaxID=6853 RepID=UPI003FCFB781
MIVKPNKQTTQRRSANKKNVAETVKVSKKELKKKLKEEDEEIKLDDSEELNESGSEGEVSDLEDEEVSDLEDEEVSDLEDEEVSDLEDEVSDNDDKDEENVDDRMGKAAKGKKLTKKESPAGRKCEEKGENVIQKKKNKIEIPKEKVSTIDSNQKGIKRKRQDDIESSSVRKANTLDDELRAITEKRIKKRDSRTLFIRMLPEDVTVAEIKALSPDIVTCRIPIKKKRKNKNVYAFVEFNSEEKAEENFEKLKERRVQGKQIFVDCTGEKSLTHKPSHQNWDVDRKVLFITNISPSTTLEDLGEIYTRSSEIKFHKPTKDGHIREAYVKFETEEAATEAFKKSENLKLKGNILLVLFAHFNNHTNQSKSRKRKKFQKKQKYQTEKEEEEESASD